ncbi:huntingtin-associated protein 1-like isoform X2 [Mustela putorius furo]|uniref:Huntingtin-associated protein 1-like isoform X2 n=1 Tax=Mustela putorius furo TaxID=9669 RepID=A0A8U0S587_MUSPF|nr:huntingtin-associated protein 1-like isoform X2 [Mustela putorius furo]
MTAEDSVPSEELGATEEGVPAVDGLTEEAELVLKEAEAWEELELELDNSVVTSTLEASGLGPSHLSMKHVLQQVADWWDSGYRWQLRQKFQKGFAVSQQPAEASQTA